jgi:hypothetical protein
MNKIKSFAYLGAAMIPLIAGCESSHVITATIGPQPVEHSTSNANGYLEVYSAMKVHAAGGAPPNQVH